MPLAREVIYRTPGLTAKEVYEAVSMLAESRSIVISAAKYPEGSLLGTLNKVHKDFGITRRKGMDRVYRYYPAS